MRGLRVAACVVSVACGRHAPPSNAKPPEAGISIALYRSGKTSYGVVDDRRHVEIRGSSILLDNIDPGASLASLVIETADPRLQIGPCTRERLPDQVESNKLAAYERHVEEMRRERRLPRRYTRPAPVPPKVTRVAERFAPIVQCNVAGTPGKYLVRIVYVSTTLGYRVQNDIEVHDATKARIESRFAVVTPPWRARAEIVVFDGLPGGAEPPRELTRGTVTLDGGTSILQIPSREMPALLRRVFEGVGFGDDGGEENYSNDTLSVWSTLEVPHLQLARGQTRVHVDLDGEDRWIDVPMQKDDRSADVSRDKKLDDEPLRIKLWIDSTLRGTRQRMILQNDGVHMVEAVTLNMSNAGDAPREVWLEEHARPAKRRMIERAWPAKPSASGDRIRNKVVVKPGRVERVGYTLVYDL